MFQVLWFLPKREVQPVFPISFFGNVSYKIEFEDLLKLFPEKRNLYFVDGGPRLSYTRAFTRVLLTYKTYTNLKPVDLDKSSPIVNIDGIFHHAFQSECLNKPIGRHVLEIGIEINPEDAKALFDACTIVPLDHSRVNITKWDNQAKQHVLEKGHTCFHYNQRGLVCPSPFNSLQAMRKLIQLSKRNVVTEKHICKKDLDEFYEVSRKMEQMQINIDY